MSVATFNDTMASLVCEIDDRKIYNDIRSQIDVTTTTIITDADTVWRTTETDLPSNSTGPMDAGETREVTIYPNPSYIPFKSWGNAYAFYYQDDPFGRVYISATILSTTPSSMTLSITNDSGESSWQKDVYTIVYPYAEYTYQVIPAVTHPETNTKTVTIQAIDATSINLYGRRVMDLTWPLGQTQVQMQSLIETYLALYKDPRPYLSMTVLGVTDALIANIFTIKISDRVTIVSSLLGINQDFFVNSVDITHDAHGLLVGNYMLEEIPASQSASIFTLDTSELDGPDILG